MPTDVRLSSYYWDPSGIAVRNYAAASSAATPTINGNGTVASDFFKIDCGGFDNMDDGYLVRRNQENPISFTFAAPFTSTPTVVMNAGGGDGNTFNRYSQVYSLGRPVVRSASTTTANLDISMSNSSRYGRDTGWDWVSNVW